MFMAPDIIKQVIVVRTDLDMGKGKIAAQVGHACVLGAEAARRSDASMFHAWWKSGQQKVVLKVSSLRDLEKVQVDAESLGIRCSEVTDAGHTQIAPGTITCISLGPAHDILIDKVTGDLKLL